MSAERWSQRPEKTTIVNDDELMILDSATVVATEKNKRIKVGLLNTSEWKEPCLRATTEDITTTGNVSVDGSDTAPGDRILVKNQDAPAANGIYIASALSWSRALDMNTTGQFSSATVWVQEGDTNADTQWYQTEDGIIVNTSVVIFIKSNSTKNAFLDEDQVFTGENTFNKLSSDDLETPFGGFGEFQNFIRYSEKLDESVWNKPQGATVALSTTPAPNGTLTAFEVDWVPSATNLGLRQPMLGIVSGEPYTVSFWAKHISGGTGRLSVDLNDGTGVGQDIDSSSFRRYFFNVESGGTNFLDINNSGNDGLFLIWGVQVVDGSNNALPYTKTTQDQIERDFGGTVSKQFHISGIPVKKRNATTKEYVDTQNGFTPTEGARLASVTNLDLVTTTGALESGTVDFGGNSLYQDNEVINIISVGGGSGATANAIVSGGGTGTLAGITAITNSGGSGYANGEILEYDGQSGGDNATGIATVGQIPIAIDGVDVILDDRILIKSQNSKSDNGIYVVVDEVGTPGKWERAGDADSIAELNESSVFIGEGDTNSGKTFFQTTVVTDVDNSDKTYEDPDPIGKTGDGLTLKGVTLSTTRNFKESVRAASNGNLLLNNEEDVDEVDINQNDRVLVKNQNNSTQNGIYIVQIGPWFRATDMDDPAEFINSQVRVEEGTINTDTIWVETEDVSTVGSDDVLFTKFQNALPFNTKIVFSEADFPPLTDVGGTDFHILTDGTEYIPGAPFDLADPLLLDVAGKNKLDAVASQTNIINYTGAGGMVQGRNKEQTFTSITQLGGNIRFNGLANTLGVSDGSKINIKSDAFESTYTQLKATVTAFTATSITIINSFDATTTGTIDRNAVSFEMGRSKFTGENTNALIDINFTKASDFTECILFRDISEGFFTKGIIKNCMFVVIELNEFEDIGTALFIEDCETVLINGNKWKDTPTGGTGVNLDISGSLTDIVHVVHNVFESSTDTDSRAVRVNGKTIEQGGIGENTNILFAHNEDANVTKDTLFDLSEDGLDETDTRLTVKTNIRQKDSGLVEITITRSDQYARINLLRPFVEPTKIADPLTKPTSTARSVAFSSDGRFLAAGSGITPFLAVYERIGAVFTKIPNPSTLPDGATNGIAWSPNDRFLAIAHEEGDHITIYEKEGITLTKLADPATTPVGTGNAVDFSPNGRFLAVGSISGDHLTIYEIEGNTFTKITGTPTPGNIVTDVDFSPNSEFLAICTTASPFIVIYQIALNTFTKLTDPATLPAGICEAVAFSPNSEFLAVGVSSDPRLIVYQRDGTTFTKLANLPTLPAGTVLGVGWSPNSEFLVAAHVDGDFMTIYERDGTTFTIVPNPDDLPPNTGFGADFSPNSEFLVIGHIDDPRITIYQSQGTLRATSNVVYLPIDE